MNRKPSSRASDPNSWLKPWLMFSKIKSSARSSGAVVGAASLALVSTGILALGLAGKIAQPSSWGTDVPVRWERESRNASRDARAPGKLEVVEPEPQTGPQFDLSRSVIAGGGGSGSSGNLSVDGTIGEVSASNLQSAGQFTQQGGFWPALPATAETSPSPSPTPTVSPSPSPSPSPGGSSSIQFSSSVYLVGEADVSALITVTRTGDTSTAAAINYRTTDTDTFTVNCAAKQGQAYGRCDFATVVGTAGFAPGETSKTFTIPIIDDAYGEGTEIFSVVLSSPSNANLVSPFNAVISISDNESVDGTNAIFRSDDTGVAFFVRQHYLDFLGREPEPGEPWSNVLRNCPDQFNINPNSPSANCDRIFVSGSFFGSPEFKDKGFYIIGMYRVSVNRLPTYVEFSTDLASISGTTAAEVFAKRAAYATNFVARTEFANIYAAMSNTTFVSHLMSGGQGQTYNLTSITTKDPASPDIGSKVTLTTADLINGLNGATLTRGQVLRAIAQSDEITLNKEAVNAFVASQYYGYLRRTPDTGGFNSWVAHLTANPNDFRTMVNGFVNSNEYRLRFGPL